MNQLKTALEAALMTRPRDTLTFEGFRKAAVLVPLIVSDDTLELLFTVRSPHLSNHAGEIAFPGGRLDQGESFIDAACREAHEEIGLLVNTSDIVGYLDDRPSPAEYIVTPVVAVLDKPETFVLNPYEVTEVFTVPVLALHNMTPRVEERMIRDQRRMIYFYPYQDRLIWGLTGNIVKNVLEILYTLPDITIE
jgi:8-oxo-dGTP pyrophosphatase MutT (NUDIX family)